MRYWLFVAMLILSLQVQAQERHIETALEKLNIMGLPKDPTALYFIIVGDWGRNGQADQQRVANWMGVAANQVNAKFVISTGDNFYCCGVASTSDYQWISSFENIYRSHSLQIPWYTTLGNHDYQGNVEAQVNYTNISQRWKMPARYYSKAIRNVRFIFTDTSPFVSDYYRSDQYADLSQQDTTRQLVWVDSVLQNSREKWKIVVGHHPVYSLGEHGSSRDLQRLLMKRMAKGKVDAYIAGHDHSLQSLSQCFI
jgi:predicted MPP superfamily phosphohydrolase